MKEPPPPPRPDTPLPPHPSRDALDFRVRRTWAAPLAGLGPDGAPLPVRSASGIAPFRGGLAIVQDDAGTLAWHDPATSRTEFIPLPIPLPPGAAPGAPLPKSLKPDLEALCRVPWGPLDGHALLALSSGSTPARRWLVLVPEDDPAGATCVEAPSFFESLERRRDLVGAGLNLEGALWLPARGARPATLLLAQRGNAAPAADAPPRDALLEVPGEPFLAHLQALLSGERRPFPAASLSGHGLDLGTLGGVRLTLTDLALADDGTVWYAAAAEASPDAVADGPVSGSALGRLGPHGDLAPCVLTDDTGAVLPLKVEGLTAAGPASFFAVTDADGASPALLLHLSLEPAPPHLP
ncbi:hypothetical protein L6R50_27460 [Myxococcota bacterium]|nr:hypothetical protein [Myxococcota bacterium]